MRSVLYKALPYSKEEVTLALESGVDGIIVPDAMAQTARRFARCRVLEESAVSVVALSSKADEERAAALAAVAGSSQEDSLVLLADGWEIIPLENLLAATPGIAVEAASEEQALLAAGVLERGVDTVVVPPRGLAELKQIVAAIKYSPEALKLAPALVTAVSPAGMGHRVCVDTTSILHSGQGMLVGNSAAFTFLVNAETEPNEYVASRPFRINAGAVHAYAVMPGDRTAYLEELAAGREVLIADHEGRASLATVGRVKVERRPMLLVEAVIREDGPGGGPDKAALHGAVFLQNAETIRLVTPGGGTVSVVDLKPGDTVLCRADVAGRHFGMRITEDIKEG